MEGRTSDLGTRRTGGYEGGGARGTLHRIGHMALDKVCLGGLLARRISHARFQGVARGRDSDHLNRARNE